MADQQLNIKLNVIDNASKAFDDVKNSLFSLKTALIGIATGATIGSIITAGSEIQKLTNQFVLLAPSVKEGLKSIETLQKFISTSPLEAKSIQDASETVFALTKNSDDLVKTLFALQNASITLGIPLDTLTREFANLSRTGIEGTRELKRKGLEELLGFSSQAGIDAKTLTDEFLKQFGKGGRLSFATEAFGNTWEGASNRFKNSIGNIKESIAGSGVLNYFTATLDVFADRIAKNPQAIAKFVKDFSTGLIEITKTFFAVSQDIVKLLSPIVKATIFAIQSLYEFLNSLPEVIRDIGFIGFFLLGGKGKAIVLALAGLDAIALKARDMAISLLPADEQEKIKQALKLLDEMQGKSKNLTKEQKNNNEQVGIFDGMLAEIETKFAGMSAELEIIYGKMDGLKNQTKETNTLWEGFLNLIKQIKDQFNNLNDKEIKLLNNQSKTFADTLSSGIKDFSKGLAESIVLGKSLGDTLRSVVQNALVRIISSQIELLIRLGSQLILEKAISNEKVFQASVSSGSSFGSLLSFGMKLLGGGTSPFDTGGEAVYTNYPTGNAEGGAVKGGIPTVVGERGRELFIPSSNGTIVPNHDLVGGTNITFNIQANDVRGIRELLIDNRATIINLVNQGANAKGRSNVV